MCTIFNTNEYNLELYSTHIKVLKPSYFDLATQHTIRYLNVNVYIYNVKIVHKRHPSYKLYNSAGNKNCVQTNILLENTFIRKCNMLKMLTQTERNRNHIEAIYYKYINLQLDKIIL